MKALINQLLGRTGQEAVAADRVASKPRRMPAILRRLEHLPQFTSVERVGPTRPGGGNPRVPTSGLLNILNGCLVAADGDDLRLTWQLDSYETPGHSALLTDIVAIDKFVALMEAQARTVGWVASSEDLG